MFVEAEICEALGLKNVIDFDLKMDVKDGTSITIKYRPDEGDLKKLVPILKKYKLVELPVDDILIKPLTIDMDSISEIIIKKIKKENE